MKPLPPPEPFSEQDTFTTSPKPEEDLQARSPSCDRTTALLNEINSLAETNSVSETLELTARLLAEVEIAVTRLTLDRGGFVTVWEPPQAPARGTEAPAKDASVSARAETTSLEAHCRGELNPLMKRAAGAILKAAVIQTERCSHRAWQFAPVGGNETDGRANPTGAGPACGLMSEKARALRADIERVARLPYNILITGETGTGKTRSAREIHRLSARSARPFMELNCANLPEQLVEAELFGYRKGAFTGADRDHKGLFEEADGGILFLDEIGDIAPAVQNKLLKVIDEKQIKRLGTNRCINCDVQIIAATSRHLPEMIRRGEFREDLFCRLAVLTIEIAPLRERREDIPAIIDCYLREAARAVVAHSSGQSKSDRSYRIEQDAVELLCEFDYPGNIRVLRNLIYELTSYVMLDEAITAQLVSAVLGKIRSRELQTTITLDASPQDEPTSVPVQSEKATSNLQDALRSMAREGDIILPLEVCLIRQDETFRQWAARAKQCSIEAARQSAGGTLRSAADRLGATRSSLKGHLQRAKTV